MSMTMMEAYRRSQQSQQLGAGHQPPPVTLPQRGGTTAVPGPAPHRMPNGHPMNSGQQGIQHQKTSPQDQGWLLGQCKTASPTPRSPKSKRSFSPIKGWSGSSKSTSNLKSSSSPKISTSPKSPASPKSSKSGRWRSRSTGGGSKGGEISPRPTSPDRGSKIHGNGTILRRKGARSPTAPRSPRASRKSEGSLPRGPRPATSPGQAKGAETMGNGVLPSSSMRNGDVGRGHHQSMSPGHMVMSPNQPSSSIRPNGAAPGRSVVANTSHFTNAQQLRVRDVPSKPQIGTYEKRGTSPSRSPKGKSSALQTPPANTVSHRTQVGSAFIPVTQSSGGQLQQQQQHLQQHRQYLQHLQEQQQKRQLPTTNGPNFPSPPRSHEHGTDRSRLRANSVGANSTLSKREKPAGSSIKGASVTRDDLYRPPQHQLQQQPQQSQQYSHKQPHLQNQSPKQQQQQHTAATTGPKHHTLPLNFSPKFAELLAEVESKPTKKSESHRGRSATLRKSQNEASSLRHHRSQSVGSAVDYQSQTAPKASHSSSQTLFSSAPIQGTVGQAWRHTATPVSRLGPRHGKPSPRQELRVDVGGGNMGGAQWASPRKVNTPQGNTLQPRPSQGGMAQSYPPGAHTPQSNMHQSHIPQDHTLQLNTLPSSAPRGHTPNNSTPKQRSPQSKTPQSQTLPHPIPHTNSPNSPKDQLNYWSSQKPSPSPRTPQDNSWHVGSGIPPHPSHALSASPNSSKGKNTKIGITSGSDVTSSPPQIPIPPPPPPPPPPKSTSPVRLRKFTGQGQDPKHITTPGGSLRPGTKEDINKANRAAELMTRTGHTVTLKVGKQGAIYHGLGALLNTPSPTLPRAGSPRRSQGAGGKGLNRPKSEEVSRYNGPHEGSPMYPGAPSPGGHYDMQRPLHQQMGAQSSPALAGNVEPLRSLPQLILEAERRDRNAFWHNFVLSGDLNADLVHCKSSNTLRAWRFARSQEQLRDPNDPYGQYRPPGGGVPQSQSYHDVGRHAPPHPNQYPDPAALRSKSTSHLDSHDLPYHGHDNRQVMSTSTLPGPGSRPGQARPLDRPGSQPELYQQRPEDQRPDLRWVGPNVDRDYENYPGPSSQPPNMPPQQQHPQQMGGDRYGPGGDHRNMGQPPQPQQPIPQQPNYMNHQQIRDQYNQYNMDPRGAHSMSDLQNSEQHGFPPHQNQQQRHDQPPMRPKSEELDHSRVTEWQKQNEMERWGQQRQPPAGYNGAPQHPQGMPLPQGMYGQHPGDHGEPPRGPPQGQQFPPTSSGYPSTSSLRGREPTPPFDRRSQEPEDPRRLSGKPATPTKPKHQLNDGRQGNMYDSRGMPPHQPGMPQGGPQGLPPSGSNPPPSSQYPGYSSQASPMPPHSAHYQSALTTDTRTVHSQALRDKPSPIGRGNEQPPHFRPNQQSPPDLPPPPPDGPPPGATHPHDWHHPHGDELPPPPPPGSGGTDLEQQIREEEEKMLRRMAGLDPYGRDPRNSTGGMYDGQDPRFVSNKQQPEPQRPSPPGSNQPNYPPQSNNRASFGQTSAQQGRPGQYPYMPKKENDGGRMNKDNSNIHTSSVGLGQQQQKRPPVAAKPKVMPKPNSATVSPSPWERAEKERQSKVKEEEITRLRDNEIAELEGKPYLNPEEQERLRRLRLDQEFERRVKEVSKDDEEEGDSDNDITDRPSGRAVLFRQMQENLQKKQQQIVEGRAQMDREKEQIERDKIERQERRLQQFEKEREEQKQRQAKRAEKQEREAEAYLARQRDLRERQRREQEEQQRSLRMEEERRLEKQREDLRRKREMEKEQIREMAMAREAEERAMREEEMARQKDMNQNRYSYEAAYRAQPAPPGQPVPPPQPNYPPPTPPERRSSYDIATHHNLRNSGNMPDRYDPNQQQTPPRSMGNNSALRQAETPSSAKKSVSFDSNLAVEINEKQMQYGSTSSESSLYNHQQQQQMGGVPNNNNSYVFRGSSSSSTSDPPPTPFQRPNYGPGPTTPQAPNDVFEQQRTPNNQGPPATLVPGPTPGVVGAQEVYRDPRDRIAAQKAATASNRGPGPERMSFRDKMSMFAKEAGEQHTPKERQKTSRAQRVIETDLNGQSVA